MDTPVTYSNQPLQTLNIETLRRFGVFVRTSAEVCGPRDGGAPAGGGESSYLSCRCSRGLAIGDGSRVRPPRPSSAILLPLINSTSLLLR
jgi:hypothetical protein